MCFFAVNRNLVTCPFSIHQLVKFAFLKRIEVVYNHASGTLDEVIYLVYGRDVYDNLLKLDYIEDEIKVEGFVVSPKLSRPNRTYQSLFINGRYVENYMVSCSVKPCNFTDFRNFATICFHFKTTFTFCSLGCLSFEYVVDEKVVYNHASGTLDEVIYLVYGRDKLFSTSSLTTEAGFSTTSPAAIRL